ncbi:cytochrome C oxidase subunit IV family protein [Patulibacter minatonensis]|uniref:cytochrome C oxidase subunit IV family protein n=1 Tax=Patulibacter minatonensis TaxID=298163 RepID=UPI0006877478|nr:cytochrome C oxidase subunit IV family protein [Patulibacter minatonensis]
MQQIVRNSRASVVIWAALVVATLASWWLGIHEGGAPGDGATVGGVAVLVITFVKVWFVGRHFMDIRESTLLLRTIFDAYVVLLCTALCVLYLVTS